LKKWNKDRVFPRGFALNKGKNAVRVQWHLGPTPDGRDEDGVSCDDVCASLAFDGLPQVCVDDMPTSEGILLQKIQHRKALNIVGRQIGFECEGSILKSKYGPSVVGPATDRIQGVFSSGGYVQTSCLAAGGSAKPNCQTRMPKTHRGRKLCPCAPLKPTGYGFAKNSAGKRRSSKRQ